MVWTEFAPTVHHIGFEGIIHGGVLATVLDEAMVWAATWKGKRFCVCAEMTVRFLAIAAVNEKLRVEARLTSDRRVMQCDGKILNARGEAIALATGKYMRLPEERNQEFLSTLVETDRTRAASQALRRLNGNTTK
jgi:acyl-coenzyme A thioesterase PaaI-like protein